MAPHESVGRSKLLYVANKRTAVVFFFKQRKLNRNFLNSCVDLFVREVVKLGVS